MDKYLYDNGIENIFYVGFEVLECVLDKPNGIYSYRQRELDKNRNIFLIEEHAISYSDEIRQVAISLLKRNNIGVIASNRHVDIDRFKRKNIDDLNYNKLEAPPSGKNFILIYENQVSSELLNNFQKILVKKEIDYGVVRNSKLYYKDKVISILPDFLNLLNTLKVDNVYYSGYHINNEILWDKFGIISLIIKDKYFNAMDSEIFVISDLIYVVSSSDIGANIEKSVILNHYGGGGIKNISADNLLNKNIVKVGYTDNIKDKISSIFEAFGISKRCYSNYRIIVVALIILLSSFLFIIFRRKSF